MSKQAVFTVVFLLGTGGLSALAVVWPRVRRVYLCLLFLGVLEIVDVNYLSREEYRGWVRGFEVGTLDMVVIGLAVSVLAGVRPLRLRMASPVGPMAILFVVLAAVSSWAAFVPLYAGFGLLKLVRDLLVLLVVANAVRDEEDLRWLVWTSVAVVGIEAVHVAYDYLGGTYRARADFSHANTLGMFLNIHLPIVLSYLLNVPSRFGWLLVGVVGAGAASVVLTLSRGSWVAMFVAVAIVVPASLWLRARQRKLLLLALMAVLAVPPGTVAVEKMVRRIREAPAASGEARHSFNASAREMAADRFLGVGLNNYSYATDQTTYAEPYLGGLDQGGLCHNLYFLTLGETGWPGLAALLGVVAAAYWTTGRFLLTRAAEDLRTVWMIGWLGGLTTVLLQSWLEWAVRQTALSFTFHGMLGVMAAVVCLPRGRRVTRWRVRLRGFAGREGGL